MMEILSKMHFLALIGFYLIAHVTNAAPGISSGTSFIIGFSPSYSNIKELLLKITSKYNTSIHVEAPSRALDIRRDITAYHVETVSLVPEKINSSWFEVQSGVSRNGVKVTSDKDITINVVHKGDVYMIGSFEVLSLGPENTEFHAVSYSGPQYKHIIVAACEDETEVIIYTYSGGIRNQVKKVIINDFDTYTHVTKLDASGFYITTNRPVSVNVVMIGARVTSDHIKSDLVYTTAPPVVQLGKQYLAPPLGGMTVGYGYVVKVVGTKDNTSVTIQYYNGWPRVKEVNLDTGAFLQENITLNNIPTLITCSEPCMAVQIAQDRSVGDSFMQLLPPIDHYLLDDATFTVPSHDQISFAHFLTIVALTQDTEEFSLQGGHYGRMIWQPVYELADFQYAIVPIKESTEIGHVLKSKSKDIPYSAWLYGMKPGQSYASLLTYGNENPTVETMELIGHSKRFVDRISRIAAYKKAKKQKIFLSVSLMDIFLLLFILIALGFLILFIFRNKIQKIIPLDRVGIMSMDTTNNNAGWNAFENE